VDEFTVGVWAVTGLKGEVGYVFGEVERGSEALPNATLVGTVNVEVWDEARPLWTLLAGADAPAVSTV
jgi:hypothetical protein